MKRITVEEFDKGGNLVRRTVTEEGEGIEVRRVEYIPFYPYMPWYPEEKPFKITYTAGDTV